MWLIGSCFCYPTTSHEQVLGADRTHAHPGVQLVGGCRTKGKGWERREMVLQKRRPKCRGAIAPGLADNDEL